MEVRRVVRCGCGQRFCLGEGVGHRRSHHHQSLKYREDKHFTILLNIFNFFSMIAVNLEYFV